MSDAVPQSSGRDPVLVGRLLARAVPLSTDLEGFADLLTRLDKAEQRPVEPRRLRTRRQKFAWPATAWTLLTRRCRLRRAGAGLAR